MEDITTPATKHRLLYHSIFSVCISWYLLCSGVEGASSATLHGTDVGIDLKHGFVRGFSPYVTFLQKPTTPKDNACSSQAVLRIAFPEGISGFRLSLTYGLEGPRLWTVHVSDSPTGNGFGGNDNTTSNNAELNVHNKQMRLYGNQLPFSIDAAMNGGRLIKVYDEFVRQGSRVTLEISDERFEWKSMRTGDVIESPFLFTLSGQRPAFGAGDDYIYVGLNRIVSGTYRSGSGLCRADIKVYQSRSRYDLSRRWCGDGVWIYFCSFLLYAIPFCPDAYMTLACCSVVKP